MLVLCILGAGQWDRGTDPHLWCLVRLCIIYTRVRLCTRYTVFQATQSNLLLLSSPIKRDPTLFLQQAYLAPPFILVRNARQKETSAQWENALIIHDHLTIQDLVCMAYVVFLISVRQPNLLMAVSLQLLCMLYLWMIKSQHIIHQFCWPIVIWNNIHDCSIFCLLLLL